MSVIQNSNIDLITDKIIDFIVQEGPGILGALLVLVIGWKIINFFVYWLDKLFQRTDFDDALESFVVSVVSIGLRIILLVSVAGMLGFETTTLITMLGAMAFAVGMALQGSLSNFAGGVLILIFKPFKVGDFIEVQGYTGTVKTLQIFQTILHTIDNKEVIIPNGDISNGAIINYSATGKRRIDMVFGIGYGDDLKKAKGILQKIIKEDRRVLKENNRKNNIVLGNLGDNSVEIYCQVWVNSIDYLGFKYDMNEKVKEEFDKNNINFPYPQQDIHLIKDGL